MKTLEEILQKVKCGMTREEVVAALGEPDAIGCSSRKYPTPALYKYGDIELHFQGWKNGGLCLVYSEDKDGNGHTHLIWKK